MTKEEVVDNVRGLTAGARSANMPPPFKVNIPAEHQDDELRAELLKLADVGEVVFAGRFLSIETVDAKVI